MDDVKDKMKGFANKLSNPFSSSSSGRFRGQGRVLGSSSAPSPRQPPPQASRSHLEPQNRDLSSNGSDPIDPIVSSGGKSANSGQGGPFECPVCRKAFLLEEEVVGHVELCLESQERVGEGASGGEMEAIVAYLSAGPPEGSVEVLVRLLGNLATEPGNAKFRKVRMGNSKIKEAVGDVVGAVGVLECAGFAIGEEEGEVWATMGVPSEEEVVRIREVVGSLKKWKDGRGKGDVGSAMDAREKRVDGAKEIDRQVRIFYPLPGSIKQSELPDSFYNLTAQELKREVESRKKKMADSQLLIPKSYKEKQMQAARKKYKSTIIRIQFPDGVILQAVFQPSECTSALYEFVSSALKEPALEFDLLLPAMYKARRPIPHSPRLAGGRLPTLEEEELVPSALLKFRPRETDSVPFTGLRSELLEASEPLTAAAAPTPDHGSGLT